MLTIKKYAAIDIGSNAVRLLIANIIEEKGKATRFKKSSLVRHDQHHAKQVEEDRQLQH